MRASWPPSLRDLVMIALGIISIGIVVLYQSQELSATATQRIIILDAILVVIFLADWLDMLRRSDEKKRWLIANSWLLLGMFPVAWGPASLRILRLMRLVRVLAMIPGIHRPVNKVRKVARDSGIGILLLISGTITVVGSTFVWLAERHTNADLATFGEAVWWGVVTVTTVGYGDITPETAMGRTIAVVLMLSGIGTIGLLASQVTGALVGGRDAGIETRLASLVSMHEAGHLTEDEFKRAKRRLLK